MLLLLLGKTGKDVLGPRINAVERGIIVETLACDFVVDGEDVVEVWPIAARGKVR